MPRTTKTKAKLRAATTVKSLATQGAVEQATVETPTKRRRAYLPAHERRQRIISAAQRVFARSSLQGARTRELAKAAQINQATLFEHFASKEELFHAAVVEPMLEAMQGMRERAKAYSEATSVQGVIDLATSSSQRHLEAMVKIYPLLATSLFSDPALGKKLYMREIAPMLQQRGEVMRGVVKETIDPDLLALAAFGAFFAVAMDQSFRGRKDDLAAVASEITNLLAFGFMREHRR